MKIDLHSHTYFSDGQLSPKELVDRAHNMQVDVLAITDHDTVAGLAEAIDYQATQKRSLQIISGVELSTSWHNFDIHILGLNLDRQDPTLLTRLQQQSRSRDDRAKEIAAKLAKVGIENVYEEASLLACKGQISRAHFARVLVARGVVKDNEAAFKKYLGKGKKAHVKPQWIEIPEAITWIQEAGGKAVLAHPGHYDLTAKWLARLIGVFADAGGDGMEVIHSHLSPERKQNLANLAAQHNLCASAGSDFHFPNRWTELGRNLKLPEQLAPIWQDWQLACLAN
jgi:predicted metal-dependent phosphoesterase TrpH